MKQPSDGCTGLVGAKLAEIPNVSIALAWPIFTPLYSFAVSQSFSLLLSLKIQAFTCTLLILKVRGTYQEKDFSLLLSLNGRNFISGASVDCCLSALICMGLE